jgi:chromosome segregation ATPase
MLLRSSLLLLAILMTTTAAAQTPAGQPPAAPPPAEPAPAAAAAPVGDVATELAAIRAVLAEIAANLKRQSDQNELSILMKRVELQQFLLMENNRQLQALRDSRDSTESQMESMTDSMREMEDDNPIDERTATGEDLEQLKMRRRWKERMEREQAKSVEQIKKINAQITELESQTASTRDDISRWQAMIDDWFDESRH